MISEFLESGDFSRVRHIQKEILTQYQGDFSKHISYKDIPRINMVWDSVPMQLAKENKKFFFGQIKKGARSSEFETAIQWLTDCGLVYKVHKVNEPHVPLKIYKDFSAYKLFTIDVGLLGAMSDLDIRNILNENNLFVEFKGALTEQYVLQQILSDTEYTPYYFSTNTSRYEQDFIIEKDMNIIPIEVKASTNVHSPSLKAFYDKYRPDKTVRLSLQKYITGQIDYYR